MKHDIDRTVLEKELAQTTGTLAEVELDGVGRDKEKERMRKANLVLDAATTAGTSSSDSDNWRAALLKVERGYGLPSEDSTAAAAPVRSSSRGVVSQRLRDGNPRSPTAAAISAGVLMDSEYVARRKAVREQRDGETQKSIKGTGFSRPGKDWSRLDAKVAEEWVLVRDGRAPLLCCSAALLRGDFQGLVAPLFASPPPTPSHPTPLLQTETSSQSPSFT